MEKTESVWFTREEVWQKVVEPLLADPVAREAYDPRWGWQDSEGMCLYLDGHDQGSYLSFCFPERSFIFGYEHGDGFRIVSYPLPEGMAEKDWPRYVRMYECVIEGAGGPEKELLNLVYGDPVNLITKDSLLVMIRDILWIMAGATFSRTSSTGEPWRAEHNREREEWFVSAHPGEDPVESWDVIPRYVIDAASPRAESLTRTFANLEFRLNCQSGFGPA